MSHNKYQSVFLFFTALGFFLPSCSSAPKAPPNFTTPEAATIPSTQRATILRSIPGEKDKGPSISKVDGKSLNARKYFNSIEVTPGRHTLTISDADIFQSMAKVYQKYNLPSGTRLGIGDPRIMEIHKVEEARLRRTVKLNAEPGKSYLLRFNNGSPTVQEFPIK